MSHTEIDAVFLNNSTQKNIATALQNHPQIPWIIDSLNRCEKHHITLVSHLSEKIHRALIESLAQQLCSEHMPTLWRECQFIYFAAEPTTEPHKIMHDFLSLMEHVKQQRLVCVMPDFFYQQIETIALPTDWRLIVFTSQPNRLPQTRFTEILLSEPDRASLFTLLKMHRTQLENFHRVSIADDIVTQAFTVAAHYLPGHSPFDKTVELLDSVAAHVNLRERRENHEQKALVTSHALMQVVSHWTQIPLTHLHNSQFQAQKLADALKKTIFGQDAAIRRIAVLLQNACIKLQD